ncbi:MAG: GFA family protein [Pseudomonadota bacterium]
MAHGAERLGETVSDAAHSGGCQCGAVRYSIRAEQLTPYACHCSECQKQSASAFGLSVPVFGNALEVKGELSSWRRPTGSGSYTDCHFCPKCGTRVYHAGANRPGMVTIKGGSLDDASELRPVAHIWTRSRQNWVILSDDVPHWETQPGTPVEWMQMLNGTK